MVKVKKTIRKILGVLVLVMAMGLFFMVEHAVYANGSDVSQEDTVTLQVEKGDDITTALQQAVKNYSKVIIPAGEYTCKGVSLNGCENVVIEATGVSIIATGESPILYSSATSTLSKVFINGGSWDMDKNAFPAFRFYGITAEVIMSDVAIQNSGDVAIRLKNAENIKFDGVSCINNVSGGILIQECKDIDIQNSLSNYNGYGIKIADCSGVININNSNLDNNTNNGANISNCNGEVILSRSYAYYSGDNGIIIKDCRGSVLLYKVKVKAGKKSGVVVSNCQDVLLNALTINNNAEYGINVSNIIAPDDGTYAVTIKACSIVKNGNVGIRVRECDSADIKLDTVSNNKGAGYYVADCDRLSLNTVTAIGNASFGINVNNVPIIMVKECSVSENGDVGIRINSTDVVKITGGVVVKNKNTGIYVVSAATAKVSAITSTENVGYGIYINNCTTKATVQQSEIYKNGNTGIFINATLKGVVNRNNVYENGAHGIYILDSIVTLQEDNVLYNYWCGLSATGVNTVVYVKYGNYCNNGTRPDTFEDDDTTSAGVAIYSGATGKAEEVICNENRGCGITVAGEIDGSVISKITVYGCTMDNNGDHGIASRPYGKINIKASSSGKRNSIRGNVFSAFLMNDGSTSDYIRDCDIIGNDNIGLSIGVNTVIKAVSNCVIADNGADGIHVFEDSYVIIDNCIIKNNNDAGVGVYKKGWVRIKKCTIDSNKTYGIVIDESTADVISSTVSTKNGEVGIMVRNGSKVNEIDKCNIDENSTYGLYVGVNSRAIVSESTFSKNKADGIRISGSGAKATLEECVANNNAAMGTIVTDGGRLTVLKNCEFSSNQSYGVYCGEGAGVVINKTEICDNISDGIRITGKKSAAKITNTTISGNGGSGIVVTKKANLLGTQGTIVQDNGSYGLYLAEGSNSVLGGVISRDNKKDGIRVTGTGTAAKISTSEISGNLVNGIVVTGGAAVTELKDATVEGNAKHGIAVYADSTLSNISNINANNNGENQIYVQKGALTDLTTQK